MDHKKGCSEPALKDMLLDREWALISNPFRHVVAQEVFKHKHYESMVQAFRSLMSKGTSETFDPNKMSRNMGKYDAYGYCFNQAECGPFEIFFQREWHDLFADMFNVKATGDIEVCLHHHKVGSLNGSIHNDYNPAWFPDGKPGEINASTDVHNKPAEPKKPGGKNRLVVRAISVIFFLNNAEWEKGDGGETGFYEFRDTSVDEPDHAVPPVNNSLLAFECTPFSYHSFISNVTKERNSLIMWLHRDYEEAADTWGAKNIVWWKR
jgi:hypothetical protein